MDILDFDALELILEENPAFFLSRFAEYKANSACIVDESHLNYLHAKSLIVLRQFELAEKIATDLLGQAVSKNDYFILSRCNILLSHCYNNKATLYRVKPCLELAEEYARASDDIALVAHALDSIGSHYHSLRELSTALEYHLNAVNLLLHLPPCLIKVQVMVSTATVYLSMQNFPIVLEYLNKALSVSQAAGIIFLQLSIINNLSATYIKMQHYEEAGELIHLGLNICERSEYPHQKLQLMFNLGSLHTRQEQYTEAITDYDQCLSYAQAVKFDNPFFWIDLYNNYAACYGLLYDNVQALFYINKAEALALEINNPDLAMRANVNKSNVLFKTGKFKEAKTALTNAISYYRKHRDYPSLLTAKRVLSSMHEAKEDYLSCIKVQREMDLDYQEYVKQLIQEKAESCSGQVQELTARYDEIKHKLQIIAQQDKHKNMRHFIGQSEASQKVLNSALLAAQHPNANVFIMGESGTGKEIIANIIHYSSLRREYPLVPINTSAITSSLVESELFGHLKGAFTGALANTKGYFVQADKGTLFLDEVTEMPIDVQVKLLRALESGKVSPVGSSEEIAFDSRIISCTNRNIYEQMQLSEFRLDLFHRLNTIEIFIPPLRNRPEDIEILVYYFVDKYTMANKRAKPLIHRSFFDFLQDYPFPGNVRELKHIIERLFIMCDSLTWDENSLQSINLNHVKPVSISSHTYHSSSLEQALIIKALIKAKGKQKDAAKLLKMSESTLTRRISQYKLENYTRKNKPH